MNIAARLEKEHSRALTVAITKYVGEDADRFDELTKVFFSSDVRLCQRSAWAFSEILLLHPHLLKPYFPRLIKKLNGQGDHVAVVRNILRVLQVTEIPQKYEAQVLDICLAFIKSELSPIAVRAFAITTAERLGKKYPELGNELLLVLSELNQRVNGPAISVRLKRAIKVLRTVVP